MAIYNTYQVWAITMITKLCTTYGTSVLQITSTISALIILSDLFNLMLHSLFAAWLFWTFYNISHNMKALVILSHSWSPFLPLTCLYGKNEFVGLCVAFLSIFLSNNSSQITYANHMTMTTSGQILSWPDYCQIKENVNIM